MNALGLAIVAVGALALGYLIYGRLVSRWLAPDSNLTPPAVELRDGVDFVPARHWTILFGHHFASIAGAAPVLGPVMACLWWGWLPAILWIVLGGIFFGAVHDYFALVASAENKGRSVGDLSESVLGRSAKVTFTLFVLLALILVVAVFAAVAAKTLQDSPQVVIPTFGLIPVAMLVGVLIYRTRLPHVASALVGLALLFGLLVLGYYVPVSLPVGEPEKWWIAILLAYCFAAAVLPVWVLLQPRDYLSCGILFGGMLLGFAGIVLSHPSVKAPAFVSFRGGGSSWLWPMLFVTIACGAISGFHSLVASGTTSKQLPRMQDARRIGYGGMIAESAVSVLALIAVAAGLYWSKDQVPSGVAGIIYRERAAGGNWIGAFGAGYGELTRPLLGALGALVGVTMLNAFVATTLDTATRIARYLCSELLGDTCGIRPLKNRYVATGLVVLASAWLAFGNWRAIWPVFGSANQLIAALVLVTATVYLISRGRAWLYTAVPAALLLATTIGALIYQIVGFLRPPAGGQRNYLLSTVAAILVVLALFVVHRGLAALRARAGAREPGGTQPGAHS